MTAFRKLDQRVVYEGSFITTVQATFVAPSGETFERDLVLHPGAVSVVPIVDSGTGVLLVRQYRAAVDEDLLEIPAGVRDVDGEPPEETARRELEEEVGMRAGRLERLADFYHSPGFTDEHAIVFLARDLEPTEGSSSSSVEEDHLTVERVALDDVHRLIAGGEIVDAKTIIGLCLALHALGSPEGEPN